MDHKARFLRAVELFRAGTEHDREAVALLYQSGAASGYVPGWVWLPAATAWLGWAHQNGRGVPKDGYTALLWYRYALKWCILNNPNKEWIQERVQRLEAQNPQPQSTPTKVHAYGLGRVVIQRGESYSYRLKGDYAEVTISAQSPYDKAIGLLWESLDEREKKREKSNLPTVLDENLRRDYPIFQLRLERGTGARFDYRQAGTCYTILTPRDICFEERLTREEIIRQGLCLMKRAAEEYLPKRLKELSERIGLSYTQCRISHGHKTLGSFYNKSKHIDLSYHLMKRTPIQVDAVLVHELCHGVATGHGEAFRHAVEQYGGEKIAYTDLHLFDHPTPIDI